jgi:hypothetical protein
MRSRRENTLEYLYSTKYTIPDYCDVLGCLDRWQISTKFAKELASSISSAV